jgi:hypothetical protein
VDESPRWVLAMAREKCKGSSSNRNYLAPSPGIPLDFICFNLVDAKDLVTDKHVHFLPVFSRPQIPPPRSCISL